MADFEKPEDLFPNPDEFLKNAEKKFKQYKGFLPIVVVGIVILAGLFSSFYSVGPDEVGVIRQFGRYARTTNPGLHLKVPFVEQVNKVKVKYIFKEEFGFRTTRAGVVSQYSQREFFDESLMLTGDLNVLVVEWIVQFKIKDPVKLLFNVRNPLRTVRNISEAVMRQVIGDNTVNEVLTTRRVEVNLEAQKNLQEILDSYESGIQIVTVKLQDVNPKFIATWQAYQSAKDVTRKRLYLEAMNEVLPKIEKKFIIDSKEKGVLPLLMLNQKGGE